MKGNEQNLLTPIELFGSIEENFYQLGLKDRLTGKIVHADVKGMLKTPYTSLNKIIERSAHEIIKSSILKDNYKYPHLKAYAEGMELKLEEVYYNMLIPELVSAMTKWAPGLVAGNLGCSSFFMKNNDGQLVHGRILDFPLQGTYDKHERLVSYQLDHMPKTLAYNTAGIPYPSITAMTENGMTIALHQKFTNVFNKNGESIFEIIFDLIKHVDNREDAIKFLKSKTSFTTWCLYLGFKNGDILAYDIMGDEHFYNQLNIEDNNIIYFCNHLENKIYNQKDFLPLGFHDYNCMRNDVAQYKIKEFIKKNHYTDVELLKMMSSPLHQSKNQKLYRMDNITPTSILACTLNPESQTTCYINGEAPKIYQNNLVKVSSAFHHLKSEHVDDKKYKGQNHEYQKGLHALTLAQKAFDNKDPHTLYHELQFAIDHLEGHKDKLIAEFYFLIAQYLYEDHHKVLATLLSEFKKMEKVLDGYLKEQCLLFIFRLEYILKLPITLEMDLITSKKLRDIIELEMKIPRNIFHLTHKLFVIPRIDILDVIYVYTH